MRTTNAEAAEALAEREDARHERIAARLRRRRRGRRPARLDRLEIKLAAEHLAAMDLAEDGKPTGLPVGL